MLMTHDTLTPPLSTPSGAVPPLDVPEAEPPVFEPVVAWVEANQTLAMLSAFALGVLVGVLMRR